MGGETGTAGGRDGEMKPTKEELIAKLKVLADHDRPEGDSEDDHMKADGLLLDYIDDPEIEAAYDEISKWYS